MQTRKHALSYSKNKLEMDWPSALKQPQERSKNSYAMDTWGREKERPFKDSLVKNCRSRNEHHATYCIITERPAAECKKPTKFVAAPQDTTWHTVHWLLNPSLTKDRWVFIHKHVILTSAICPQTSWCRHGMMVVMNKNTLTLNLSSAV